MVTVTRIILTDPRSECVEQPYKCLSCTTGTWIRNRGKDRGRYSGWESERRREIEGRRQGIERNKHKNKQTNRQSKKKLLLWISLSIVWQKIYVILLYWSVINRTMMTCIICHPVLYSGVIFIIILYYIYCTVLCSSCLTINMTNLFIITLSIFSYFFSYTE